jgi:hypothetical protein
MTSYFQPRQFDRSCTKRPRYRKNCLQGSSRCRPLPMTKLCRPPRLSPPKPDVSLAAGCDCLAEPDPADGIRRGRSQAPLGNACLAQYAVPRVAYIADRCAFCSRLQPSRPVNMLHFIERLKTSIRQLNIVYSESVFGSEVKQLAASELHLQKLYHQP